MHTISVFEEEESLPSPSKSPKCIAMLSLLALSATAFNAPALQPGTVSRSFTASMQLNKKVRTEPM